MADVVFCGDVDQPLRAVAINLVGHLGARIPAGTGREHDHVRAVADIVGKLGQIGFARGDAFGEFGDVGGGAVHRDGLMSGILELLGQAKAGFPGGTCDENFHVV